MPERRAPFPPDVIRAGIELTRATRLPLPPRGDHLTQFVLKTVAPCNLACTYCYEYIDDSWKNMPPRMSPGILAQTARRIGRYAAYNQLDQVAITFHGGEPLMAGAPFYLQSARRLREEIGELSPSTNVTLGMQTNGTLLTPKVLDVLAKAEIDVAVSLDGDQLAHDRHRVNHNQRGTHQLVMRGLQRLLQPKYSHLFGGLLCVVDIRNDPLKVYEALMQFDPPQIDFLLPYGTWDQPPFGKEDPQQAPYGEWLQQIFQHWWTTGMPGDIRLFRSIIDMLMGGDSRTEAIGPYHGDELVIRTDGTYELVDALKMTANQSHVTTGMSVENHDIEIVAQQLRFHQQLGRKVLSTACRQCPFALQDICGGGHITTTYSKAKGFDNPSVFCTDLALIIQEIADKLFSEIFESMMAEGLPHRSIPAPAPLTHHLPPAPYRQRSFPIVRGGISLYGISDEDLNR